MAKTNYEIVKAWRKLNPDKVNAQAARRRAKHPEKYAEASKRYRAKGGQKVRDVEAERARKYRKADPEGQKIRQAKFKAKQEAKRAEIAGRPRPSVCDLCRGNHHLGIVFDHCHANGKFRGWLCDRCNKVLGLVYDDAKLLRKMVRYLEKANGKVDLKATQRTPIEIICAAS